MLLYDKFAKKRNFLFLFYIQCDIMSPLKSFQASSKGRKKGRGVWLEPKKKGECRDSRME